MGMEGKGYGTRSTAPRPGLARANGNRVERAPVHESAGPAYRATVMVQEFSKMNPLSGIMPLSAGTRNQARTVM
jgi:hypothetical protein